MSDRPATADEQDDAAFRARLAPLAWEVLPPPPAPVPRSEHTPSRRRPAVVLARSGLPAPTADVPRPSTASEPSRPPSLGRRRTIVTLAGVAAAVLLAAAWLLSRLPWTEPRGAAPSRLVTLTVPSGSPPSGPSASGPSARSAMEDGAGAAAPASAVPPPVTSAQNAAEAMIGLLMRRGDTALADGDIVGARLLFERAAAMGSAAAATAAGETYDIDFLLGAGARGIRADPAAAALWYRKAAALGDPEAQARLARAAAGGRP